MADVDRLKKALRAAHAAGDTSSAKRIAQMIKAQSVALVERKETTVKPDAGGFVLGGYDPNKPATEGLIAGGLPGGVGGGPAPDPALVADIGARKREAASPVGDVAAAATAGVARGAAGLVGLPGSLGDLIDTGLTKAGQYVGVIPKDWQAPQNALSGAGLTSAISSATGGLTDYKGKTTPGQYAGTVGEFLPGAAAFGGMGAANLLKFGVVPGVASEAAGQATEGSKWEPLARIGAAVLSPSLVSVAGNAAKRMVSPYGGADPERLGLAQVLDDAGIPLTAGQRVGNEALRRKEGLTAKGQEISEAQLEAFTGAALKSIGATGTRATPDVLESTAKKIGAVFDDVTKGVDVAPDQAMGAAIRGAVETYKSLAPAAGQAPIIGQIYDVVSKAAKAGKTIPATTVNVWRSRLSKLTTSSDTATREAARVAMDAIDDALSSTLTAIGKSDAVAALSTARQQWRDFLAIQKVASMSGEGAAVGILSPSSLRSAIAQQGRAAYAQGKRGEIGELARAAEGVMKRLPTSGTAENLRAMMAPAALWSALGAGVGGATPLGPMAGAALGAMAPVAAGALRMSRPAQAYLANQLAGPSTAVVQRNALSTLLPFSRE